MEEKMVIRLMDEWENKVIKFSQFINLIHSLNKKLLLIFDLKEHFLCELK
jgi:hypothetical protein